LSNYIDGKEFRLVKYDTLTQYSFSNILI